MSKARILFKDMKVDANFIEADIRDIPKGFLNSFDISMSFGLAEHFDYPQRREVVKLHADLIKAGGVSFIAVPNIYCLPYRVFLKLSERLGYSTEVEIPYSRKELKAIAASVGFKTHDVVGSSFIKDTFYFSFSRFISHLTKWRVIIDTRLFEIPCIFDDYFGYSLVLVGAKDK